MAQMRHVYRGMTRGFEKRIERHGISMGVWYFLRVLWEEEGLSQAELRERVGIGQPTTVAAIARLGRLGLVDQRPDPNDGRKVRVFLTPVARELKHTLMPEASDFVTDALSALTSDELHAFRISLRKIASKLEEHIPPSIYTSLIEQKAPKATRRAKRA